MHIPFDPSDRDDEGEDAQPLKLSLSRDGDIFALVDADLLPELIKVGPWHLYDWGGKQYGKRTRRKGEMWNGVAIYLHRWIAVNFMSPPPSHRHILVDHIDGDGLNCTRENLRWATPSENRRNVYGRWWQQKDFLRELDAEQAARERMRK